MTDKYKDPWDHATPATPSVDARFIALGAIAYELDRAYKKHGAPRWGRHEALSIIREEFEEAWDVVRADGPMKDLKAELTQLAAMCIRYLETEPAFYPELQDDSRSDQS